MSNHLAKGHRLQDGKYRIEKKIGQGGFGITYLARWYMQVSGAMGEASSYAVVVVKEFYWSEYCNRDNDGKTVSITSSNGKEMFTQFKEKLKKEGKLLSKFQHPNIVSILDVFEENNTAYLVMQNIEGDSLREIVVKDGKVDSRKALKYIQQLCSALTEVHNNKILHLDIKPSNILVDEDDNAQLIDFGVSKQYSSDMTGAISETPFGISRGYSPMEQYSGISKFSPSADVYALGATLYYLLTGKTPLEATMRVTEDMDPIAKYNQDVSSRLCKIIDKAMELKPINRFQSVAEFSAALEEEMDENLWNIVKGSNTVSDYESYLQQYPKGHFVEEARKKIEYFRNLEKEQKIKEEETTVDTTPVDSLKEIETKLVEKEDDIRKLQSKISALTSENSKLRGQVEEQPKSSKTWIVATVILGVLAILMFFAYLGKSGDGVDTSGFKTTISEQKTAIESLQNEKKKLQDDLNNASAEITRLKSSSSSNSNSAELAQKDKKITELQQQVNSLQSDIKQKDSRISTLQNDVKKKDTEIDGLKKTINQL